MWPEFIEGRHHKIIADKFNKIADGKLKRLIVCLPPRHSKSEFASTFFPAWMMGRRGDLKIIQTTHTAELAVVLVRKVRNIIDSEEYQHFSQNLKLQADNKSAGRWTSNQEGEFFAAGVGGAITGRGADLLLLMILILNKMLCHQKPWNQLTNGTHLDQDSVYNQAE